MFYEIPFHLVSYETTSMLCKNFGEVEAIAKFGRTSGDSSGITVKVKNCNVKNVPQLSSLVDLGGVVHHPIRKMLEDHFKEEQELFSQLKLNSSASFVLARRSYAEVARGTRRPSNLLGDEGSIRSNQRVEHESLGVVEKSGEQSRQNSNYYFCLTKKCTAWRRKDRISPGSFEVN